jgi:hypothetical protein
MVPARALSKKYDLNTAKAKRLKFRASAAFLERSVRL